MGPIEAIQPGNESRPVVSAVAWTNGREAIVATMAGDGEIFTCEINRGQSSELSYLALVVHALGNSDRVAILGSSTARLALEREYVAIFHRPDRIIDEEPTGAVDTSSLVARLRALAA
jgi:hypothetical protein